MAGRATAIARAKLIREVVLDYGAPEVSIEPLQGRPASGDRWNAADTVGLLSHHIASRPTAARPTPGLALVKAGRSDLGGPLANGTAGVDLVYRIICLGLANHPGRGGPWTVAGPLGKWTVPRDLGRGYLWGTEYEGGYDEDLWSDVFLNRRTGKRMEYGEFMGRCNAALSEAIWLPGISSRGRYDDLERGMDLSGYHGEHKTWAPGRKPDRLGYSTASGRAEMRPFYRQAATGRPTTTPATPTPQEDDMSVEDLLNARITDYSRKGKDGKFETLSFAESQAATHHRALGGRKAAEQALRLAKRADARTQRIEVAVRTIVDSESITVAEIKAAVADLLGQEIDLTVELEPEPAPDADETPGDAEGE